MTIKIHFTSSNSKEALFLKSKYCELYNQANLREADVIVAIGGDGEMLKALRLAIKNNYSVFGLIFPKNLLMILPLILLHRIQIGLVKLFILAQTHKLLLYLEPKLQF